MPELTAATDRLRQRIDTSARRLQSRLQVIADAHDLRRSDLTRTTRELKRMGHDGSEPSPTEFWEMTAEPMAAMLLNTSIAAIDDELAAVEDAIDRFSESVRIINRSATTHVSAGRVRLMLEEELRVLERCAASTDNINRLAGRWSNQLRRAAWRRQAPLLLFRSAAEADALLSQAQVALVETAPWAHTDRLLSAFELCHADIRTHLIDKVAEVGTLSPVTVNRRRTVSA
ncbi:MAG: hypothetical protein HKN24_06120 [Acidimicrobiales bacterium]|nr:hypothetical protein [Acidimicrobiales bacterium]